MTRTALVHEVFTVLHDDIVQMRPEYRNIDAIVCPICLRDISKSEIIANGIEHILPRNLVIKDPPEVRQLGTKNQRCGVTVLCRSKRMTAAGVPAPQGCNGLKGLFYDRLFARFPIGEPIDTARLTHRHGVAILMMAYLGAFQIFGYEYILRPELDDIRLQFDNPDTRETAWLDQASIDTRNQAPKFVAARTGHPFFYGGALTDCAPLELLFRNFRACLPCGHWRVKTAVRTLASIAPQL